MSARVAALEEQYRWLIDGLRPYFDRVAVEVFDYGCALSVAALWTQDGKQRGQAIHCQGVYNDGGVWKVDEDSGMGWYEGGQTKVYSLNEKLIAERWARAGVIGAVVAKRAPWAARAMWVLEGAWKAPESGRRSTPP